MNPHPRFSVAFLVRAWFGFVPLANATLLVCLLAGAPPLQAHQPEWTVTGSPGSVVSYGHTATLLANGEVLVVSGSGNSTELYDPVTGRWSPTGNLSTSRVGHSAVRLANGKVLVAGGFIYNRNENLYTFLATAEIYDPGTGVWSVAGSLNVARAGATATLLADGSVLVAGGGSHPDWSVVNSAELYDPTTGAWIPTGTMSAARVGHTATLLASGKVLVASGSRGLPSAELYDPATASWTATGNPNAAPTYTTALLLPSGQVLVAGGGSQEGVNHCDGVADAELYDPATGQWSTTGRLMAARAGHSLTLLPNGSVLAAGGFASNCESISSSEIYDPVSGAWIPGGTMNAPRDGHTATLLANGKVLVVWAQGEAPAGAELFDNGTAAVTSISAANFVAGGTLAPESIAAAFGVNLAAETQAAASLPLPTEIAGVSVKVRDRTGAERLAPLFFVSALQINYQVPPGTVSGLATVTVTSGGGFVAAGLVEIAEVAPGLFSTDTGGQSVAAAMALRFKADGSQQYEPVARLDSAQNRFVAEPIDLGPATDQVFLVLFGTGIKLRSALSAVSSTVGGVSTEALFAGAAPEFPGLDQVNLRLPRSLAGSGEVEVRLSVDGKAANTVWINIR
jgi:uncharacterized protein (TIGR03437 family)